MKPSLRYILSALAATLASTTVLAAGPHYSLRVFSPGVRAAIATPPDEGTPPPAELPAAVLSGETNFGEVTVGQAQGVVLTLTNTATHTALNISDIQVSGAQLSRMGSDSCPTQFPASLPAAASCTISAVWSPTTAGALANAQVAVQDDAGGHLQALAGTAILPSATSSITGATDFGSVLTGASKSITVTVANTSQYTPLQLSNVSVAGTGVTWTGGSSGTPCRTSLPQTLAPKDTCTVDVVWSPTTAGALKNAALTITDSAHVSGYQVDLTGTGTLPSDPYFANVTALLHMDDLSDSSTLHVTPTLTTGAAITSTTSAFGGNSLRTNSGGYMKLANNAGYSFGTGDFTVEFWMNSPVAWTSQNPTTAVIGMKTSDASNGWQIYRDTVYPTKINARVSKTNGCPTSSTPATGVWEHWALTRQGTVLRWFKNGVLDATCTSTDNVTDTAPLYIGYAQTWGTASNLYFDDVRITKGIARTITLPKEAFPNK